MRSLLPTVLTAALLGLASAAQAMPSGLAPTGDSAAQVIPVADGCGPGFHRNFRGFCRPNGFFGARRFFRGRPAYNYGYHRNF